MTATSILLGTLNSTYQHSSFGLRYLLANMGDLQPETQLREWTIKENPRTIVEQILKIRPKIMGFSLYIWNSTETLEVLMILKKVAPDILIVLGGPEISFETEIQPHIQWCDYVIKGEADFAFRELCEQILIKKNPPNAQILSPALPDIQKIIMPYDLYTEHDLQFRVIYVEASRGCPYKCEYCLSSLDKSVRNFELEPFLQQLQNLLNRGARTFKFVDRTFNLSPTISTRLLQFFLDRIELGLFLHFELVPDRLPAEIRELIQKFPAGSLQFEIGIQTLNPQVAQNVSRKNDLKKVADNFAFIKEHTHVHTHADLIVGLPGESLESFASGFDQLQQWGPDEIQVGILKRLRGTPIARHEKPFQMIYSEITPYQILSTNTMDYLTLQKMNRFAKFWDLYANSGEFKHVMQWFQELAAESEKKSLFWSFFDFSEFLSEHFTEIHSISLMNLSEKAWLYMIHKNTPLEVASELIEKDYCYGVKRRDRPAFLKTALAHSLPQNNETDTINKGSKNLRQLKHLT